MELLTLPRGGSFLLTPQDGVISAALQVNEGYVRLSSSFHSSLADVTLAFSGPGQPPDLWMECQQIVVVEALTDVLIQLEYSRLLSAGTELTRSWLLALNLVRHCLGAEQRVNRLLCLLAQRFGNSIPEGVTIPFVLSHARIAELIGVTRPTVTRQLVRLRDNAHILTSPCGSSLVLTAKFLDSIA